MYFSFVLTWTGKHVRVRLPLDEQHDLVPCPSHADDVGGLACLGAVVDQPGAMGAGGGHDALVRRGQGARDAADPAADHAVDGAAEVILVLGLIVEVGLVDDARHRLLADCDADEDGDVVQQPLRVLFGTVQRVHPHADVLQGCLGVLGGHGQLGGFCVLVLDHGRVSGHLVSLLPDGSKPGEVGPEGPEDAVLYGPVRPRLQVGDAGLLHDAQLAAGHDLAADLGRPGE